MIFHRLRPLYKRKKSILLFCTALFLLALPLLFRLLLIITSFPPAIDLDSAIILVEWSENEVAEHFDSTVDIEESRKLLAPMKKRYGVQRFYMEGPFNPYTETELNAALKKYEAQFEHLHWLIENNKVLVTNNAEHFRSVSRGFGEGRWRDYDEIFDKTTISAVYQINTLIRSRSYQDLENRNFQAALKNLKYKAKIANPIRAQNEHGYASAITLRRLGYRDYYHLPFYEPPSDVLRHAWQDMIDLRRERMTWACYPYLDMRNSLTMIIDTECVIEHSKNNPNSKIPDSELSEARIAISEQMLSNLRRSLHDCYEKANLFQDPETRSEARKYGNPQNWRTGFPGIIQSAFAWHWYTRTAQKDPAIFKQHKLPQDILEKVDPVTAMLYLQSRREELTPKYLKNSEIHCQLYELSVAACVYQQNKNQWPEDIDALRLFYEENRHSFPENLYDGEGAFHCGWKTLEGETLHKFLEDKIPYDSLSIDETDIRIENNTEYINIARGEELGQADLALYTALKKHKEIISDAAFEIFEDSKKQWRQISLETALEMGRENRLLREAFEKKYNMPESKPQISVEGDKVYSSYGTETIKYFSERRSYISNPENRTTPYPDHVRLHCELNLPDKAFAIWYTVPETIIKTKLYILPDFIVFPE